jgi:hypothetical protein
VLPAQRTYPSGVLRMAAGTKALAEWQARQTRA